MAVNIMDITVVIHFLDSERYLGEAIESVVRQTFSRWELVLVDGGSSDRSEAIARSYQSRHPDKIRVLRHQGDSPLGIFSSRLWGAREAQTPIVALLDSDDEWHPQFLSRHRDVYRLHFGQRPGMIYCPVVYWWEPPESAGSSFVQPVPMPGLHESPSLVLEFIEKGYEKSAANSGVMISRELLLEAAELVGTASESVADDQFLWSFLLLKCPVFVSPEPLARYRQWEGSTCALANREGKSRNARRSHLVWLREYLVSRYRSRDRNELIAGVEQLLLQEFPRHSF